MKNCKNGLLSTGSDVSCDLEWYSAYNVPSSDMEWYSAGNVHPSDLEAPLRENTGKHIEIKLDLGDRPTPSRKKIKKDTQCNFTEIRPRLQNSFVALLVPMCLPIPDQDEDHAVKERGHRIIDKVLRTSTLAKEKVKEIVLDRKANNEKKKAASKKSPCRELNCRKCPKKREQQEAKG